MAQPMIAITNVKISPNPVKTGESFKIAVKIIELTEDNIRLPYRLGRTASLVRKYRLVFQKGECYGFRNQRNGTR